MTRLSARKVGAATLAPGARKKVTIAGKEDVPAGNVGAVLLRLRTAGARKPGALALASSAKKLGTATAFAYPKGAGQDLALPKLSNGGAVVIKNRGKKKVKVVIDAISSFSKGGDPEAFGDTLNVVSPLQIATADSVSHTAPFVTAVAGVGDIPAEASTVPPSMVLLRALAEAPTTAGILSVIAEHAIPGVPSLRLKASKPSAGLVPALPSSENNSSFVTSKGTTQVSAEAYAYFAGGTVMNPNFRTLSAADLAAIQSDPPPDSVTFSSPVPPDLNDLAVGDIISAGGSDHTPTGFLRTVTSIDNSGADLIVQTEDAGLADAVEQAHLSWGGTTKAAAPSLTQSVQASPRRAAARSAASTQDGPSCSPDFFAVGASIDCSVHTNQNGVNIDVSQSFRLDWQGTIDVGLLGVHMTSAITVSDTLTGELSAGATDAELDYTKNLYQKFLTCPQSTSLPEADCSISPFPPIGPLDLWITPVLSLDLKVTGHIDAGLSATGSFTKSATANFGTDSAPTLDLNEPSFEGNVTKQLAKGDADVKIAAVPSVNLYLTFAPVLTSFRDKLIDGTFPSTKLSASLSPYLRFTADFCAVKGYIGLDLSIGLTLKALGFTLADVSWSPNIGEKEMFDHPWRNCAYWTGTLIVRESLYYDNGLPADQGHYKAVEKGSSTVTIHAPKDKEPPEDGFYHEKGSGSGLRTEKQWLGCTNSLGATTYSPFTTTTRWSGALTNQGLAGDFYFDLRDDSHRRYTLTGPNPGNFGADWERTTTYLGNDVNNDCVQYETHDQGKYYGADVWSLIDNGASSSRISFQINATGAASGTLHIEGDSTEPKWTVVYDLQKICTKGGVKC
jgi:hypothetical protein